MRRCKRQPLRNQLTPHLVHGDGNSPGRITLPTRARTASHRDRRRFMQNTGAHFEDVSVLLICILCCRYLASARRTSDTRRITLFDWSHICTWTLPGLVPVARPSVPAVAKVCIWWFSDEQLGRGLCEAVLRVTGCMCERSSILKAWMLGAAVFQT